MEFVGHGRQAPLAAFGGFEMDLRGDVRARAGADEAEGQFIARADGGMDGEFQFDGAVEFRIEPDIADIAMGGAGEFGEGGRARKARGTAVRAEDFPAEVQEAGAGALQEQPQGFPPAGAPVSGDGKGADVRGVPHPAR